MAAPPRCVAEAARQRDCALSMVAALVDCWSGMRLLMMPGGNEAARDKMLTARLVGYKCAQRRPRALYLKPRAVLLRPPLSCPGMWRGRVPIDSEQ